MKKYQKQLNLKLKLIFLNENNEKFFYIIIFIIFTKLLFFLYKKNKIEKKLFNCSSCGKKDCKCK